MSAPRFNQLSLPKAQIDVLDSLGYQTMTPIQAQSLPAILEGKDVIARAKTGSGKTAAFGIGLLQNIKPQWFAVQSLVLCPTRELADQVGKELRKLARFIPNLKIVMLCGGKSIGPQIGSLENGAHIVVGTPGRIQDHLRKKTLDLSDVKTVVLDEADRMLDMGFVDVMHDILGQTPKQRQTLLFSATYPDGIAKISRQFQQNPVTVTVESEHQPAVIEQLFYEIKKHERNNTLRALFEHYQPKSVIVFCHTKKQCDEVAEWLNSQRISARAIHGDLEQRDRDQVLACFDNQSCPVLVATDVAARGLDIKNIDLVINYELPRDPEVYVHRIGRTGRAGEKGLAMSLAVEADAPRMAAIERYLNQPCRCDVPASLDRDASFSLQSDWTTIQLDAGRKQKMRPGDILGALTGDAGLAGTSIGKINILDMSSYVAIANDDVRQALNYLAEGKIKNRSVRARKIR
ncbi:ATP-dependent RNA helicase DbpA [Methylophaga sp. OBS3]|uniref:ATP-dependent RNA helicase DbpA n=1 Tax=Methylophaga sp. OBS3 TaxID=2991934 RepID=UPI0022574C89|nr:ATP-dependent RNA helicase DbpA [Methylophaga sp. OBS3]MCX4190166.1 ATP-dependent RNA helicase DbpA [Methylophaga sp. OBS3]